jgi:phosphinothricin acetyltransferase
MDIQIRYGMPEDLARIVEIRNHYILNSNALFETRPVTSESLKEWFGRYKTDGPHRIWVGIQKGEMAGFAYSSKYRDGEYFSGTVETSIYIDPKLKAKGLGSALYAQMFKDLKNESLHTVVVGIALPNPGSIALHKKFGFEEVGVFKEYARKGDQYISSLWMQKML